MDIKRYISSGVLELYVLGVLDKEEEDLVERMSEKYVEVQQALEDIQSILIKIIEMESIFKEEHLPIAIWVKINLKRNENWN